MSNDDEDLRAEVRRLRLQVERLGGKVEMVGNILHVLDHDMGNFAPELRAEVIDHLRTLYRVAVGRDEPGAELLLRIAADVTELPRDWRPKA